MFTKEEKDLIIKIFSQITISASDPASITTAGLVQGILKKINE